MEKKYFTNKTSLFVWIADLAYVVLTPVLMVVLYNMDSEAGAIYTYVFSVVMLMSIGFAIFWGKKLIYPVVKDDRLVIRNLVFASQSKEIMYSSVNYLKVTVVPGGEALSVFIALKDGSSMNYALMTAGSQSDQLIAELESKGISDVPSQADSLPRGSEKMYRNPMLLMGIIFMIIVLVGMFVMVCYLLDIDFRFMDADSIVIVAGLGLLIGGVSVFMMMTSNYVVLEQNRLVVKNFFFPFRDRVFFFSDVESAHLDGIPRLIVTFRKNPQDAAGSRFKRVMILLSGSEVEELNNRLDQLK